MSTYHCTRCGRGIFRAADLLGRHDLWQAEVFAVSALIDEPGLTRYDVSLHQGWYCCRFIAMRMVVDKFGTGDQLLVYADSVVEVPEGQQPPTREDDKGQLKLSRRDFDEVVRHGEPDTLQIVKFGAIWCPPCRLTDAVISRLAEKGGVPGVRFFEVDIDEEQELAGRFEVQSVPFFVFYRGGRRLPVTGYPGRTINGALIGGLTEAQLLQVCARMRNV